MQLQARSHVRVPSRIRVASHVQSISTANAALALASWLNINIMSSLLAQVDAAVTAASCAGCWWQTLATAPVCMPLQRPMHG